LIKPILESNATNEELVSARDNIANILFCKNYEKKGGGGGKDIGTICLDI